MIESQRTFFKNTNAWTPLFWDLNLIFKDDVQAWDFLQKKKRFPVYPAPRPHCGYNIITSKSLSCFFHSLSASISSLLYYAIL